MSRVAPADRPDMTTDEQYVADLERSWGQPPGWVGWFMAVNHRAIGARFVGTGMLFFVLAGIAALLMRIQLARPENTFLSAEAYNQLFTMHGTTMMFLFAIPIMEGIGIYVMPLMIGARDMAFPRMNAFGYWVYVIAGSTIWVALFFGVAPDAGWFNYPPLADARFSPGVNIDFWAVPLTFLEIATLVAAIEIITTILCMRAPGMTLNRIPLFVWAVLVMAFMILFAMPALIIGGLMIELDRKLATSFFIPGEGGDPLLWQHLFWFFGHPEVYIMLLPGLGIVTAVVTTFSRRPIFGYTALVLSLVAIGVISFGVWVHHMFATGRALLGMSLFSVMGFLISVASGVQIFATLSTLWHSRAWLSVPLLWVFGFIFIFVAGGITGVMVSSIPFDLQVHDTYFVVAHFHYVILGGVVFPLLAGIYYWFPKFTGRMLDDRLGVASFWLTFLGMNITFFTMHITGFLGMPRRVYTYLAGLGWDLVNLISTIGAFVIALGVLLYIVNILLAFQRPKGAPGNPWRSGTLEWAADSPPSFYNFRSQAYVRHRDPLWFEGLEGPEDQERLSRSEDVNQPPPEERYGVLATRRETLGTSVLEAVPEQRVVLPTPTIVPMVTAFIVGATVLGFMVDPWAAPIGLVFIAAALFVWHRPSADAWDLEWARGGPPSALPASALALSRGVRPPVWWGMLLLLAIEATLFAAFLTSYYYIRTNSEEWPHFGLDLPDLMLPAVASAVLLTSALPVLLAYTGIRRGYQGWLRVGLLAGIVLAFVYLGLMAFYFDGLDFNWAENAYASLFWGIVWFHGAHVLAALLVAAGVLYYAVRGYFHAERADGVMMATYFWVFVVVAWVPSFLTVFVAPHLLQME